MKRLILALLLIPTFAYATDWKYLGKKRNGEVIYYDKDGIHHPNKMLEQGWLGTKKVVINKDIVGVWVKGNSDIEGGGPHLIRIECSTRKWSYKDYGFESFPTETLLHTLHSIVCK